MLVYQMRSTLLPIPTHFVAALHEASKRLLALVPPSCDDWVVILAQMQLEEVFCREVFVAFRAPVGVGLSVMRLVFSVGSECQWLMRRQQALHSGARDCTVQFRVFGGMLANFLAEETYGL